VNVLYNDGNWVLIKWPGCSYEKVSPWVEQYPVGKLDSNWSGTRAIKTTVWDSETNGRLTTKRLAELVVSLNLNPEHIQVVVPRSRSITVVHSRSKQQQKKKRKVKLETCAVKVCLFVRGLEDKWFGDDCEDALEGAKIVGELDETGQQLNGEYVVIMYESVADCMEFIKHDREKILDALESLT
jgi:hypothetical protein